MDKNQSNNSQDGDVFLIISGLVNGVSNFIKQIIKKIIQVLLFFVFLIKSYRYLFLGVIILGGILGYFRDSSYKQKYKYEFVIKPELGSIRQVYQDIQYYNSLVDLKKDDELALVLGIDKEYASSIEGFEIESFDTPVEKYKSYADLVEKTDSMLVNDVPYPVYDENDVLRFESQYYKVKVISTKDDLPYIGTQVIEKVKKSPNIISYQKEELYNLKNDSIRFSNSIVEIERLIYAYESSISAPKNGDSSKINIVENSTPDNQPIMLVRENVDLRKKLSKVLKKLNEARLVIKDFARYNSSGEVDYSIFDESKFRYPIVLFFLTILVLSIIKLNKYLNEVKL